MASTTNNSITTAMPHRSGSATAPTTTFVQADPSTFRAIVQQLTGAPYHPSAQKPPLTHPNRPTTILGPKRPVFKIKDRRQSAMNLQINLNNNSNYLHNLAHHLDHHHRNLFQFRHNKLGFLTSPVSTFDFFASCSSVISPRSPCQEFCGRWSPGEGMQQEEEEERAVSGRGSAYLRPSCLAATRGAPPRLLPLFPLCSPREAMVEDDQDDINNDCNSCS